MPLFSFDTDVLNAFPSEARPLLETFIYEQKGVLKATQVAELAQMLSVSEDKVADLLLPVAAACAIVPVSGFHVGVVITGQSGALYIGANMEFEQSFLGVSMHGEQSALNNAWLHGETAITRLVVNAAPCGYCRQFLHELGDSDNIQVKILSADGSSHQAPLSSYLPEAFGPGDLGVVDSVLESKSVPLSCDQDDELVKLALDAAEKSYSPYTQGFAGIALETACGTRVTGRYIENAAYSPSLQPFTSALSQLRFACLGKEVEIKRVVLVEAGKLVNHLSHLDALKVSLEGVKIDHYKVS